MLAVERKIGEVYKIIESHPVRRRPEEQHVIDLQYLHLPASRPGRLGLKRAVAEWRHLKVLKLERVNPAELANEIEQARTSLMPFFASKTSNLIRNGKDTLRQSQMNSAWQSARNESEHPVRGCLNITMNESARSAIDRRVKTGLWKIRERNSGCKE